MTFKNIVWDLRKLCVEFGSRTSVRSHITPERIQCSSAFVQFQSGWANLPPELLMDIIQRVELSQISWPDRKDVVACASVCRSWRSITIEVVKTPEKCGILTFPISLKQPGPRNSIIQCFIKREPGTSVYRLYCGLSPALSGDVSKLLLVARKNKRVASTDFSISLADGGFSRSNNAYLGKIRSNFLGTKFSIYDSQPPCVPTRQFRGSSHKRIQSYKVATISYALNILRTRGPRRVQCTIHSIPISSVGEGGSAPTPTEFTKCLCDQKLKVSKANHPEEPLAGPTRDALVLKNKAPRWHEQLQCWCLNFKGRVTVASVKNFQLVASSEQNQNVSAVDQDKVILQFGKIGKDVFTMDYRYPLSAFQAFAICLSSFDTKPACE